MSDLKYVPGIVIAVVVLVTVFGFIGGGLVMFVVTQPAVLVVLPALFLIAEAYIRLDRAVHPSPRSRS